MWKYNTDLPHIWNNLCHLKCVSFLVFHNNILLFWYYHMLDFMSLTDIAYVDYIIFYIDHWFKIISIISYFIAMYKLLILIILYIILITDKIHINNIVCCINNWDCSYWTYLIIYRSLKILKISHIDFLFPKVILHGLCIFMLR